MAHSGEVNKRDVLIALLGLTGAGKSTFANLASGKDTLRVGHTIYPCTQDPQVVTFDLPELDKNGHQAFTKNGEPLSRSVTLIDTPGFDDDERSDVQILEHIAKWMAERDYLKKYQLDGLILLHPITVHRVGGTERKRTRLLQTILGENAYKRIIIATTMWEQIRSEDDMKERLEGREKDLWSDLVRKGAKIVKHANNKDSAHKIIRMIIQMSQREGKLEPLLQVELTANPLLVKSTAGKNVKAQLIADIEKLTALIAEHYRKRPKDPNSGRWKRSQEWTDGKRDLERRLVKKQAELKRLNSLAFRMKSFFINIFRG